MRIPISCKLFGRTLKVIHSPTLINDKNILGQAKYDDLEIILQSDTEGFPISQKALEQTFYHELIHHIFNLAGEDTFDPPLHKREYLIERIANLLHQAFSTAEYDKKKGK